jgi:hypothetical protein
MEIEQLAGIEDPQNKYIICSAIVHLQTFPDVQGLSLHNALAGNPPANSSLTAQCIEFKGYAPTRSPPVFGGSFSPEAGCLQRASNYQPQEKWLGTLADCINRP